MEDMAASSGDVADGEVMSLSERSKARDAWVMAATQR